MFDWKTWLSATPIIWKTINWVGGNPGVLLLVAGAAIALGTLWKAPKALDTQDDKVDAQHPIVQVILRLISSAPRMTLSLVSIITISFGILDLTGTVPLREQRADLKIQKIEAKEGAKSNSGNGSAPSQGKAKVPVTELSN